MALSFGPNRLYAFECLQNVFCTTANHQKKFPSVDSHIVFLLSLLFFSFNFWFTNLNRSKISFDLDFFSPFFSHTVLIASKISSKHILVFGYNRKIWNEIYLLFSLEIDFMVNLLFSSS